MSKKFQKI